MQLGTVFDFGAERIVVVTAEDRAVFGGEEPRRTEVIGVEVADGAVVPAGGEEAARGVEEVALVDPGAVSLQDFAHHPGGDRGTSNDVRRRSLRPSDGRRRGRRYRSRSWGRSRDRCGWFRSGFADETAHASC